MFKTWTKMENMLKNGILYIDLIITHKIPLEQYEKGCKLLEEGKGSKVISLP